MVRTSTQVSQSSDTDGEADALLFRLYRQAGPIGRLRKASAIGASLVALALDELRRRHPDEPEARLRLRLAARQLPRTLLLEAFGWAPAPAECLFP